MLRWRLLSAAVILAILLTLLWLDHARAGGAIPGAWLVPVLVIVAVLATEEVLSLLAAQRYRPIGWIVYAGNVVIPLAAAVPELVRLSGRPLSLGDTLGALGWPLVALAAGAVLLLAGEMARYQAPGKAIVHAALGVWTLVYIGVLTSFWALLRLQFEGGWGTLALVSTLAIVKMADTGAFLFGKTIGHTKMTPVLSPGKTWEGALGGIATACLTSWAVFTLLGPTIVGSSAYLKPPLGAMIAYGILLAVAGMIGDLAESLLKRDMQRKDSSTWLPGLGGVLDIIDAVLVAAPVAWLCWVLGLVGPG